jgi:hypothetical protein
MRQLRSSSTDRAQALAARAGPGIESRRPDYRKSAMRLHPCRRASWDSQSGPGESVIFSRTHTAEWTNIQYLRTARDSLQGHVFLTPQPLLLEFGRCQVTQQGVDPLAVVHVIQESTELAAYVGEVAVLGQIDLLISFTPGALFPAFRFHRSDPVGRG